MLSVWNISIFLIPVTKQFLPNHLPCLVIAGFPPEAGGNGWTPFTPLCSGSVLPLSLYPSYSVDTCLCSTWHYKIPQALRPVNNRNRLLVVAEAIKPTIILPADSISGKGLVTDSRMFIFSLSSYAERTRTLSGIVYYYYFFILVFMRQLSWNSPCRWGCPMPNFDFQVPTLKVGTTH